MNFPVIKKFHSSVMFKKVIFVRSYELDACIDYKVNYLEIILESVNLLLKKIF